MLRFNLCDYVDAYMLFKGVSFKDSAPFTKCINRINNTDIDTAQDIDIVMPMYNLIECSDNYSKTSGSLWKLMAGLQRWSKW